jgi:regulator of replication initiation timing
METVEPPTKKLHLSGRNASNSFMGSSKKEQECLTVAQTLSAIVESDLQDSAPAPATKHWKNAGTGHVSLRADGKKHVEKGSLTEAALVEAKRVVTNGKSKDQMTEEEKREERRAANRLSAFRSRQRRSDIIEDLQNAISHISKENSHQRGQLAQLKQQYEKFSHENEHLREQVASLTGNPPVSSSAATVHQDCVNRNLPSISTSGCTTYNPSATENGGSSNSSLSTLLKGIQQQQQAHTADIPNDVVGLLNELASIQAQQERLKEGGGVKRNAATTMDLSGDPWKRNATKVFN